MKKLLIPLITTLLCSSLYSDSRVVPNVNRQMEGSDKIIILNTSYEEYVAEIWLPLETIMSAQLTQETDNEEKTTYTVEITTKELIAGNGGANSKVYRLYYSHAEKSDAANDVRIIMFRYLKSLENVEDNK